MGTVDMTMGHEGSLDEVRLGNISSSASAIGRDYTIPQIRT
jgi:hypothetical protein